MYQVEYSTYVQFLLSLVLHSALIFRLTQVSTLSPSVGLFHTYVIQFDFLITSMFYVQILQHPKLLFFSVVYISIHSLFLIVLWKYIINVQLCIHNCNTIQNNVTILKKMPCAPPIELCSKPLATPDLFISIILSFIGCHVNEIMQYVAFQTGLFLLVVYT